MQFTMPSVRGEYYSGIKGGQLQLAVSIVASALQG